MPAVPPTVADEHDGLLMFLRQQHQVLRYAAHGLTDSQARAAASVSTLTIGGLLRHVTTMESAWMARVEAAPHLWERDLLPLEQRRASFVDDFTMPADESLAGVLAAYDERCRCTEEAIPGLDLDRPVPVPASPWFPPDAADWSVRWVLLHVIEETARHAGHADIVRESIDGATAFPLMAAAESWTQTPWLTPWRPTASG